MIRDTPKQRAEGLIKTFGGKEMALACAWEIRKSLSANGVREAVMYWNMVEREIKQSYEQP